MATEATRKWFEARKRLYARLMAGGPHTPERATEASDLIDDFTHALAECQREAIRGTDDPVFYEGEAGWLVNLIDPEHGCGLMCSCVCHAAEGATCDAWHCVGKAPGESVTP